METLRLSASIALYNCKNFEKKVLIETCQFHDRLYTLAVNWVIHIDVCYECCIIILLNKKHC